MPGCSIIYIEGSQIIISKKYCISLSHGLVQLSSLCKLCDATWLSRKNSYPHTLDSYTNFQCTIVNIFLPIIFSICFGCSKELSHPDGSFEYPQLRLWLKIRKLFFIYALLKAWLSLKNPHPHTLDSYSQSFTKKYLCI